MARQQEADDGRKEGSDDRCGSRCVSGKVMERLWKDYGKVGDQNRGIMAVRKIDPEHPTESRVCYGVIA